MAQTPWEEFVPNEKFPSQNRQICLPGGVNKFLVAPHKKLFTILKTKRGEGTLVQNLRSIGQETTSKTL